MVITRRAFARCLLQKEDPKLWIPARHNHGAPVTHAIDPATFADRRVRLLKNRPWPGLQSKREDGSFTSGPTGAPWINSSAWAIQLERFRAPRPAIWVEAAPPKSRTLAPDDYLLTLADTASAGGRWIIDCPSDAWPAVANATRFFAQHRDWDDFISPGVIGIVPADDDAAEDTNEVMNLLTRQAIPYRLVRQPEPGLAAVIGHALGDPWMNFAKEGGLVMNLGNLNQKPSTDRWNVMPYGKGRLAVWQGGEAIDPYLVAKDARQLLGRQHDVLRAYNIHASSIRYTIAPDRQRALIQIINFTGKPLAEETTVWVAHPWKRAQQHEWTNPGAKVTLTPDANGTELTIPRRDFYTAIELSAS